MPVPVPRSIAGSSLAGDTYSLMSSASSTRTIKDKLYKGAMQKSTKKGFTFNIMLVGPPVVGKTTLVSALFGQDLELAKEKKVENLSWEETMNPEVSLETKTFEEKREKLKLTVVESRNYGQAINTVGTHIPLVEYIDQQFYDYYKKDSSVDRRNIQDKRIHCMLFFITPFGHGMSEFDLTFLKEVHSRVNIVPIIAWGESLNASERASFKNRVKDDLRKNNIKIYKMPDPDPADTDEVKRAIEEIKATWPFVVTDMSQVLSENGTVENLGWSQIDPYNRAHSDFLLLDTMLDMQMSDMYEITHEHFYEDYRSRMMQQKAAS